MKPDEASRLEMLSKSNFYKIFDSSAIRYYKQWLKTEAEDLEALYDLGQAYARQMQWDNARNTYQAILNILPSHFRAEQALNKVNIYAKSPRAKLGFKFFEADSASRDMDKKYLDIYSSFKAPLREDLYFEAREDTYMYVYSHVGHVNRERISAGLEYYKKPYFWASGSYAYNIYSDGIDESHTSKEEVNIRPFDPTLFTLSHEHDDVLDNALTLKMRLEKDDYKIRGTASPNRRLSFGADYMYSDYNDGNERDAYGFDSSCILLYEPKFFKVTYRYEEYGFDEPRPEYFTPSSFHSNTLLLEWRHFLNKEELFWGTNDTYYTLKYGVNLDVHDLHGHTFYADFHKDWNDRFSTHVEWSKKMYEHRDVYSEDEVSAYITYYF